MSANDVQIGGDHYKTKTIQPWDAMESWITPEQFSEFLRGNVIKYIARCDDKGGVEDLKKARHYLDKLIEFKDTGNDRNKRTACRPTRQDFSLLGSIKPN